MQYAPLHRRAGSSVVEQLAFNQLVVGSNPTPRTCWGPLYTMRIISGVAGGLRLEVPKAVTRPTTDKVRQAIFSMLGDAVPDAVVLDLFAGSGAMGLECLSRGAASATFVDESRAAAVVIKSNLDKTRLPNGNVRQGDALRFLSEAARLPTFNLVFADPPYVKERGAKNWCQALLESVDLHTAMKAEGLLILESAASTPLTWDEHRWTLLRERSYGDTRVWCWSKK